MKIKSKSSKRMQGEYWICPIKNLLEHNVRTKMDKRSYNKLLLKLSFRFSLSGDAFGDRRVEVLFR